ncbi:hypothetical protein IAE37_002985 [Pseudomonas sp. S31]|uniref:LPD16 domain-containing protein n=1 Tax=Pseudomonas sp. S31 TaxID=1564473 RepID=UPI00191129B7|nr:LPD16 domain-containing protein [Pseudomonas sp. S31]MBK5000709.1 hypothetical protein [Pseudomonas sp. S31]
MHEITIKESYAFSEESLLEIIYQFIEHQNFSTLHIMAGHFMLFFDPQGKRLEPGIFEDIQNPMLKEAVKTRVGIFPTYTWKLAIQLAENASINNKKSAKLILLVNDWQYVPDNKQDTDYRTQFYERFTSLPDSYLSLLAPSTTLSTNNICESRRNSICFPETWLKNRFQNEAARLVKQGKLAKRYLPNRPAMSEISFTDAYGSTTPLVSCGMTGCAGEISEMISEAYKSGARLLILFAPSECHAPIRKGIEIALSLYDFEPMSLLVADLGGSGELTQNEIFSKGAHIVTYET